MEILTKYAPIIVSAISFAVSAFNLMKSKQRSDYLEKDKQYSDLLKLALADPRLRDYRVITELHKKGDNEFISKYNIYAYLIWNCMETFFDLGNRKLKAVEDTWLPVVRDENRIHYNWFKRNQSLFKPEFQNYINSMNDVVIRRGTARDLDDVYSLMQTQFPADELKTKEKMADLMDGGKYELYIAENPILSGEDNIIGYAFLYVVNECKSAWLDYLAINDTYQDSGYGSLLFNKIMSVVGGGDYHAFMEVEIPEGSDKNDKKHRRQKFYERQGAQKLPLNYQLPTASGGLPMNLYFKSGRNTNLINGEILTKVIGEVLSNIHSDISVMPEVRDKILKEIQNVKL